VLQARTALSQEQLNLVATQGGLQAAEAVWPARASANLPFDLEPLTGPVEVHVCR
jgi:hypothetical protein